MREHCGILVQSPNGANVWWNQDKLALGSSLTAHKRLGGATVSWPNLWFQIRKNVLNSEF